MALSYPIQGRRTLLFMSLCHDCGTFVHSSERFTVASRRSLRWVAENPDRRELPEMREGFRRLTAARFKGIPTGDQRMREPGEEG